MSSSFGQFNLLKTMKKLSLVILIVFSFAMSFANNGNVESRSSVADKQIQGKVIDKITGEALAGVAIKLQGSNSVTFTDFDGNFSIDGIASGTYDLNVMFVSYQTVTLKHINTDNSEVKLKIELEAISQ